MKKGFSFRSFWAWAAACAGMAAAPLARAQVYADFTTTKGSFTVELFHQDVPRTVANFVSLASGTRAWIDPRTNWVRTNTPYYDGILFHRVIPSFMIQGGSPKGDGTDGPGYKFPDEFTKNDSGVLRHTHNAAGMLSMANSGVHTNGSQFFITTSVTPPATFPTHLDDKHTVFGKIAAGPAGTAAQGLAVVDAIAAVPRTGERPTTDVVMQTVRIRRVGAAAEAFDELAWALPEVKGPADLKGLDFTRAATAGGDDAWTLKINAPAHRMYDLQVSNDLSAWTKIFTTNILRSALPDGELDVAEDTVGHAQRYFQMLEVDYSSLISLTHPALSGTASLSLKFSSPAFNGTMALSAAGGSWSVASPAASGAASSTQYFAGSGDAGLFTPVISQQYPASSRFPWPGATPLRLLQISLNFDPASPSKGYFTAVGVFHTNVENTVNVSGKGTFTLTAP